MKSLNSQSKMGKKSKRKRKYNPLLTGFLGLSLGIIIVVAISSGAVSSIIEFAVGTPPSCHDTPFDKNCQCEIDETRKGVAANGVQTETNPVKYYCEKTDLLLNPDSPTFRQEALNFAQEHLSENYFECNSIYACPVEPTVGVGYTNYGKRSVTIICRQEQAGSVLTFWYLWVDIEEHEVTSSSCSDLREFEPEYGQGSLDVELYEDGRSMFDIKVSASCQGKTGVISGGYTYTLGQYEPDAVDWWFHGMGYPQSRTFCGTWGTCELNDKKARSVTVTCNADCTGVGDCTATGVGIRHSKEEYNWNCILEYDGSRRYLYGGDQVCCLNQDKYFVCTKQGLEEVEQFRACRSISKDFTITTADGLLYSCDKTYSP